MGDTGGVANATTGTSAGTLPEEPTPAVARRSWPRWLVLGVAAIAVAVVAIVWRDGDRFLLGAVGAFLAVRGALLVRAAGDADADLVSRARALGVGALVGGLAAFAVAVVSVSAAGWVLLCGLPLGLIVAGALLLDRGGRALLLWGSIAAAALVAVGLIGSWDRAIVVAIALAAFGVALLGVVTLVAAVNLRAIGARPDPEPAASAGCGGCACGAGGCGS